MALLSIYVLKGQIAQIIKDNSGKLHFLLFVNLLLHPPLWWPCQGVETLQMLGFITTNPFELYSP
jgi:hypothetical protein